MTGQRLRVVAVLPDLLGTYGDAGNVRVIQQRLDWRGIPCELLRVGLGEPLPPYGDLYLLGGGEDDAQLVAAEQLRRSTLVRAVADGAHVLAVCAGLQILGRTFTTATGEQQEGLGLLDLTTDRLAKRAVGEVVVDPDPALGLPALTGFENHAGRTMLGPDARPLGRVVEGVGNGDGQRLEGACQGRVVATYLHGPVLARNPALADLMLSRALARELEPLDLPAHERLRRERLPSGIP